MGEKQTGKRKNNKKILKSGEKIKNSACNDVNIVLK